MEDIIPSMETNVQVKVLLMTTVAPVAWGSTYLVTQSWLPPDRPLFSATVRALPIGLLLLAARRELPRGDWWWKAAVLGACNISLFFALLFLGAYRLPGGLAATITAISPLLVMVLAWAALGVRAPFARVAGGVVGIVGVGLLVLRNPGSVDLLGLAGALGAVCSPQRWGSSSSRGGHRRPAPRGIGVPDRSGQPRRGHPLLVCGSCRRLLMSRRQSAWCSCSAVSSPGSRCSLDAWPGSGDGRAGANRTIRSSVATALVAFLRRPHFLQ